MRLNHVALWADDIESVRLFYMKYFGALCNDRYVNESKKFTSYFLSFDEGTACLELMNRPDILDMPFNRGQVKGLAHLSISVGSREAVDELTRRLQTDGYTVIGQPRLTVMDFMRVLYSTRKVTMSKLPNDKLVNPNQLIKISGITD